MFTKMLKDKGNLQLEKAADHIAEMGFDGADLTVRERGYVLPEEASEKLPQAIDIIKSRGLDVPMITTNITNPEQAYARDIFKTASECGVKYLKLGQWKYRGFGNIHQQIEEARKAIAGICSLSMKFGVTAAVHTHAGAYLSADPGVLFMLLKDHDPNLIGAYIDPGHMFAEAGPRGLEMPIDMLSHYIRLVAVKNYRWIKVRDEKTGETKWRHQMMPLKEEIVNWPQILRLLRDTHFDGPVSVHSEYHHYNFADLMRQTKEDLKYLKCVLRDVS